jgi:hypothetical protein
VPDVLLGQGDLYLRDDQGGVFVAVAAPLTMEDDDRWVQGAGGGGESLF